MFFETPEKINREKVRKLLECAFRNSAIGVKYLIISKLQKYVISDINGARKTVKGNLLKAKSADVKKKIDEVMPNAEIKFLQNRKDNIV